MRPTFKWSGVIRTLTLLSASVTIAFVACKKDNNDNSTPPPAQPGVQLSTHSQFGNILTDSAGKSLYFFSIDADGNSGCTGGCLTAWPIFHTASALLGTGLDAKDFGTITRGDGKQQTTYKGWPLYYYQDDAAKGDVKGDGSGAVWFVAKPDYTVMLVNKQLHGHDGIDYTSSYQAGAGVTQYITDDHGHTLYAFSHDTYKVNHFTKADLSNNPVWPIDTLGSIKSIPSLLDKSKFDTVMLFGKVQLSYNGWPLYYFGQDSLKRGNNKGISFPAPGGIWPIVNGTSAEAPH